MDPLTGKTSVFLLDGRDANLAFARTTMGLMGETGESATILDLDAFYSSNSDQVLSSLPSAGKGTELIVPVPGTAVEHELPRLYGAGQKFVIIDSMNSLFHLLSLDDASSRSRKLTFTLQSLSYFARTNGKAVILSMYRREGFTRAGSAKSISSLSDVTASAEVRGDELTVRTERGQAWPGGRCSTRIP